MRSTIIAAAAFAASAVAVPWAKRDLVTAYATDVEYVTNVVTVTQGGAAPTTTVAAAEETPADYGSGNGWHWPHKHKTHKTHKPSTQTETQVSSPESTPTSTWEASTTTHAAPTTSAAPETSTATPAPTSGGGDLSGYNDICVGHHNVHRANHSAPDVAWDSALASTAAKIAASCVYAHNTEMDGGGYGQNIAAGVEANNVSAVITDLFYNGEVGYYDGLYGEANPDMSNFESWGHFSQIVWKSTTKIGCATQYCPNGLGNVGSDVSPYFTVCNYGPPGNYGGEYGDNVLAPKNEPTVQWNYGL